MPRTKTREVKPVDIPTPSLSKRVVTTWGEEFRAAYVQAKHYWEPGVVTYEALAERVSQLVPTTNSSILRLGQSDTAPSRPNQRQIAYLSLVAMGHDPTQFGLEPSDRALRGLTEIEVRKMLDPGYLGFSRREEGDEDE